MPNMPLTRKSKLGEKLLFQMLSQLQKIRYISIETRHQQNIRLLECEVSKMHMILIYFYTSLYNAYIQILILQWHPKLYAFFCSSLLLQWHQLRQGVLCA